MQFLFEKISVKEVYFFKENIGFIKIKRFSHFDHQKFAVVSCTCVPLEA